MSVSRRQPTRRAVLRTGGAVGFATLLTIGARDAVAHAEADGSAFTRTNEVALRADDPTLSDRARDLIRIGEVGIVGGDADALKAFFHPDFRFHGPSAELSLDELLDYFAACRAAFDDFSVTRQTIMSDGGHHLATRTRFAGVFARPFSGTAEGILQPNGKPFEYSIVNVFRYAPNGQLAEEWVQYDVQNFVNQLKR
ncbi:ester cyclase [Mycolicibacterium sp. P1-18]|uniref:ester cyclase n=1 Tax=Mycolicibacterium sp. P1-18 TaxID=2024615 RepID=UPI001564EEE7|nr:ester cyclase [Mycolicibacterium sp. P1-18]